MPPRQQGQQGQQRHQTSQRQQGQQGQQNPEPAPEPVVPVDSPAIGEIRTLLDTRGDTFISTFNGIMDGSYPEYNADGEAGRDFHRLLYDYTRFSWSDAVNQAVDRLLRDRMRDASPDIMNRAIFLVAFQFAAGGRRWDAIIDSHLVSASLDQWSEPAAEPEAWDGAPQISEQDSQYQQYQQDEDTYMRRKNSPAGAAPGCQLRQIVVDGDADARELLHVLYDAEQICAQENSRRNTLMSVFSKDVYQNRSVPIDMSSDKSVFDTLLKQPLNYLMFTGGPAMDAGGVRRQAFTMAGRYIQDKFMTMHGDRYYFNGSKKGSGRAVAHILRLALMNRCVIGIPLSYGILHCMREGLIPTLDNISLPQLVYFCWKDNNRCTDTLRALFHPYLWDNPEDTIEEIQVPSSIMGYLLKKAPKRDDRLDWLHRYLYGLMFSTARNDRLMHNTELNAFLEPLGSAWDKPLQEAIKYASLDEMADITGAEIIAEQIYGRIEWTGSGLDDNVKGFMQQYLSESDQAQLKRFLIFVTGAVDVTQPLKIDVVARGRLPQSHTCSRQLDINRVYADYDVFKREMDMALATEGFDFA